MHRTLREWYGVNDNNITNVVQNMMITEVTVDSIHM